MATLEERIQANGQQYQELVQRLSRESEISSLLEGSIAERERLSQRIQTKTVELNALTETSKKEFEELRKLRHLSIRSAAAALAGKKQEMVANVQARYHQAFDSEQQCKREIEQLSAELGVVADTESQMQREMNDIRHARSAMSHLLDEIFSAPHPDYPLEAQLKAELQNYTDQTRLATHDLGRFKDAVHNLSQARREIPKAMQLYNSAITYVPFDLFGGTIMDTQQMATLEAAKRHTYEIQRRLNTARQILPEIPHPGTLDVVTNNMVLNMRFDLTYVDVAWKAKAQHAYALLATAQHNVDMSLNWVRQYIQYTEGALDRLRAATDTTRNALENERRRIVEGILSGQPVVQASPYQEFNSIYDQPPPMYEAPSEDANHIQTQSPPHVPVATLPPSTSSTLISTDASPMGSMDGLSSTSQPATRPIAPASSALLSPPPPFSSITQVSAQELPPVPHNPQNHNNNPFRDP